MNLTSRLTDSLDQDSSARAFLGDDHPLVRVCDWERALLKQSLVVAALGALSVIALAEGISEARAVLAAVAVVGATLACALAALASRERTQVLNLIARGAADLAIPAVRRERRRLRDPRHREALARWFESISDEADYAASRAPSVRPLFSMRAVAPVQPLLDEVAEALRGADPGVRGVLRAQRLLEQGGSPLYGHDADALRRELQVIRFLLV